MERSDRYVLTVYPKSEEERELLEIWRLYFRLKKEGQTQSEWLMERIKEWAKENEEQVDKLRELIYLKL